MAKILTIKSTCKYRGTPTYVETSNRPTDDDKSHCRWIRSKMKSRENELSKLKLEKFVPQVEISYEVYLGLKLQFFKIFFAK